MLYDNGSLKYKGEWKEGKPYGKGKLYNSEGKVVMEGVWKNEYDDLGNGIFRISNTCYVEIDKNEVYVNILRSGGLFGCSHRWKRYAYSDMSEDEMNDLISIQNDINVIESPVDLSHEMDIPEPVVEPQPPKDVNEIESPVDLSLEMDIIVPEPKPVPTVYMMIENKDQLRELLENGDKKRIVKELVIGEGCGNGMKDDLELCGFENLESIVVKKNTLKNLNSLMISDNPLLKSIEIENGEYEKHAFFYVKNVTITSTLIND